MANTTTASTTTTGTEEVIAALELARFACELTEASPPEIGLHLTGLSRDHGGVLGALVLATLAHWQQDPGDALYEDHSRARWRDARTIAVTADWATRVRCCCGESPAHRRLVSPAHRQRTSDDVRRAVLGRAA